MPADSPGETQAPHRATRTVRVSPPASAGPDSSPVERETGVPAALAEDPEFTSRRLLLLVRADPPAKELDEEWDRLLAAFPMVRVAHLRRFDALWDHDRRDECGPVIEAADRHHGRSSYFLARKVRWLCRKGGKGVRNLLPGRPEGCFAQKVPDTFSPDAALEAAKTLWQLPGDDEVWPEVTAWEALVEHGWEQEAVAAVDGLVNEGARVRARGVHAMAMSVAGSGVSARRRGKILGGLLETLSSVEWDSGEAAAAVIWGLVECDQEKRVYRFWKLRRPFCAANTPVWAAVGAAMLTGPGGARRPGRDRCRAWLSDWRRRSGVMMWTVLDHSICLRGRNTRGQARFRRGMFDGLEGIRANSRDALATLEHDETALYHACDLCETCLRLDRDDEFLEHLERHGPLLREAEEGGRRVTHEYAHMPALLRLFGKLIAAQEADRAAQLSRRVRGACSGTVPWWVRRCWMKRLKSRLPFWRRVWVNLAVV